MNLYGKELLFRNITAKTLLIARLDLEHGKTEGPWGQILSISSFGHVFHEVISNGMWRKLGKGNSTLFWEHCWIGETPLSLMFPRFYNLPMQKENS